MQHSGHSLLFRRLAGKIAPVHHLLSVRSHSLRSAWPLALPIIFGYLPIGFAYGILAIKAGLSPFNTLAMSLFVYAGSAQLIAVGLFAAGIAPYSIILTTFIVNLRHLLMSAALSPYLHSWRRGILPLFAFELTDETFAVHSVRFPQSGARPPEALAINMISQAGWFLGTLLGVIAGDLIRDVKPFGLDYALVAMFAALLVFQLKEPRITLIALFSGLFSTALLMSGVSQWNVIFATLSGATLGVFLELWTKTSSS